VGADACGTGWAEISSGTSSGKWFGFVVVGFVVMIGSLLGTGVALKALWRRLTESLRIRH